MKKNLIATSKIYTKYKLTLGDYSLSAKVSKQEITLRPLGGHDKFIFEKSMPETIEAMGQLFIAVSKLSENEKI